MKFIIQQEIMKNMKPDESQVFITFSGNDDWRDILHKLENDDHLYVLFVAIPVAFYIMNNFTKLTSGLCWPTVMLNQHEPNNILNFNVWSTVLGDMALNNDYEILTLGQLKSYKKYNEVFVKPLSPWKTFTGFDCHKDDIPYEVASTTQLNNVGMHELCIVAPYKNLNKLEYRCWYIEGELVTCSPYGWDITDYNAPIPMSVLDLACKAGEKLEYHGDAFVIDIGTIDGKPYVIELNAIPTSGWYDGMNVDKLLAKMENMYGYL